MSAKPDTLEIVDSTKGKPLGLPFENIKNAILGKSYELTIIICGKARAKKINILARGKTYTPNTLSLPYSKSSGELILCKEIGAKEAKSQGYKTKDYLGYLVIHSMLHLKGFVHGSKMDMAEKKFLKKFGYKIEI